MEAFIGSYGIPFKDFNNLINETNALIAGSAALALYLQQEGIEVNYKPNDLDIWVSYERPCICRSCQKGNKNPELAFVQLSSFLSEYGFKDSKKFSNKPDNNDDLYRYSSTLSFIEKVTSFMNADGQEIQIIQVRSPNLVKYIQHSFDLSCCVTWWDSKDNVFKTHNPLKTKAKQMYHMRDKVYDELDQKELLRYEKYKSRGFTFTDPPCPFKVIPDNRTFADTSDATKKWTKVSKKSTDDNTIIKSINAFDIITFDKTPIKEYLARSDWNVIIKSADMYYGFNRKVLKKIISSTRKNTICEVSGFKKSVTTYKLPFGHRVSEKSLSVLELADYSIYEPIIDIEASKSNPLSISVYKFKCYTVQGWENNSADFIVEPSIIPPPTIIRKQVIEAIQQQMQYDAPIAAMLPPGAPYNPDLGLD